jgi:hypothetical protein
MAVRDQILTLQQGMARSIIGQEQVTQRLLLTLLADGNLLLEGLPGLAKTRAITSLARHLESEFRRIQFTPDLLPSDVTGTEVYYDEGGKGSFRFQPGPIFGNLILADEINRAPAKVQAALLEAMEERQVTVAGTTHRLPPLFMVLATQNPIERGFSLLPCQPVHSLLAGRHASRLRGRGLNFEEIRCYLPGDDIRTMDWPITARTRKPHIRVLYRGAVCNRGNALLMHGKYTEAIASYDQALQLRPGWPEARANRDMAEARRQKLAPPEDDAGGTGGREKADDYVFDDRPQKSGDKRDVEVVAGESLSNEQCRPSGCAVCKPGQLTSYAPSSPTSTAGSSRRANSHEQHGLQLDCPVWSRGMPHVPDRAGLRCRTGPHAQ